MTGFIIIVLTALVFIITGHYTLRRPPAEISVYSGYRTKRSKSSIEAWRFAQKESSEWMVKTGYFMGILSTVFLLFPDTTVTMVVSIVLTTMGCFFPIYKTENALKENF